MVVAAFQSVKLAVTVAFTCAMRRHLMVWAIFTPKYIFESFSTLLTDATLLAMYLLLWRTLSVVRATAGRGMKKRV